MRVAGFDWDEGNRTKCEKHGVPTAAIEAMFRRPIAVFPDPQHSNYEERFKAIGKTEFGRAVFVVFTLRTRRSITLVRPLAARYMHDKEVRHYEKEIAALTKR